MPDEKRTRAPRLVLPDPKALGAVLDVLMIHGVSKATIGDLTVEFSPYTVVDSEETSN